MAKQNPYAKEMFGSERIIDDNAFSIAEIAVMRDTHISGAGTYARNKVLFGEWEQVWKHNKGVGNWKYIKAYRPKRKR